METSGPSSQTPDHSQVHEEPEDLDCAEHEDPDLLKDELQLYGGTPGEVVPSGESDEFFHFVLLCFAIGTLLVCYHYYAAGSGEGSTGGDDTMLEGPTEPRGHLRKGSKAPTPLAALTRPLAKTMFSQATWEMVALRAVLWVLL
ncbi:hypothetical protein PANDA_010198 [Ailuropoda melanoleuca]|uniref:Uncharacterized protein n=1 Tax=Ailuropoda melanoleuca TaxID=9646 RepID=D2HGN4_AILME|nr:hypothetical protein PANDA_010198 [Ailuropoda melanoleuca]